MPFVGFKRSWIKIRSKIILSILAFHGLWHFPNWFVKCNFVKSNATLRPLNKVTLKIYKNIYHRNMWERTTKQDKWELNVKRKMYRMKDVKISRRRIVIFLWWTECMYIRWMSRCCFYFVICFHHALQKLVCIW